MSGNKSLEIHCEKENYFKKYYLLWTGQVGQCLVKGGFKGAAGTHCPGH